MCLTNNYSVIPVFLNLALKSCGNTMFSILHVLTLSGSRNSMMAYYRITSPFKKNLTCTNIMIYLLNVYLRYTIIYYFSLLDLRLPTSISQVHLIHSECSKREVLLYRNHSNQVY